ncbi:MAG TPA: proton-conducting transporter membrane subunit, partial [Anaerolineae bacterium]|nr:proton-conducting transporter membrane subunit [Anaerolineae bacterium]
MVNWLFGGLVFAPLAAAALLPFLRRARVRTLQWWLAGVAALVTACATGLLFFIGETPTIAFTWLPGAGAMGFSLERAGLLAALATSATAAFVLTQTARTSHEASISAWLTGMVLLVALAAANAAFLSAHFLARYVALEVVGLCIALAALIEIGEMRGLRRGGLVYLLLRIGDAGLLAAILLLGARTGTLEIGPALAAAPALSARALGWVTVGFALAVSVKIGVWPFHFWIRVGQSLSHPGDLWLYATVMPNLGLYLLYRT